MLLLSDLKAAVLDTHVWIWTVNGDDRAAAMEDFSGQAFVPAISMWEASMLSLKGRVVFKPDVETWLQTNLAPPTDLAPLSPKIAARSCDLSNFHGDPADRLIVATAICLGLPLISADEKIGAWAKENRELLVVSPTR